MSADFMIYTDHLDEFDRSDFEQWCQKLGYGLELPPDFSIREEGFVPMRFRADFLEKGSFLTGFELYSSENNILDMTAEPYEPPVKKVGFLAKLFGKKPAPVSVPPQYKTAPEPGELSPFEQAAGEKKWELSCGCHSIEPLTVLAAYLFSAYFCEKFAAVTDDPQTGHWFTDPDKIKAEVENVRREMMASYKDLGQEFIPFTDWEHADCF